jgi:hypothetical protein
VSALVCDAGLALSGPGGEAVERGLVDAARLRPLLLDPLVDGGGGSSARARSLLKSVMYAFLTSSSRLSPR